MGCVCVHACVCVCVCVCALAVNVSVCYHDIVQVEAERLIHFLENFSSTRPEDGNKVLAHSQPLGTLARELVAQRTRRGGGERVKM